MLWQGRPPNARVVFRIEKAFQFIFGLFFAGGFALFWMVMASQAGGGFWMFGLIHFSAGIAISFGAIFWDAYRRRHTWYTLTDRRAFIATDMPHKGGRKLQSYPIDGATPLEFSPPGVFANITFASEERHGGKGRRYTVPVGGFERIADGDAVYRHLRNIQKHGPMKSDLMQPGEEVLWKHALPAAETPSGIGRLLNRTLGAPLALAYFLSGGGDRLWSALNGDVIEAFFCCSCCLYACLARTLPPLGSARTFCE